MLQILHGWNETGNGDGPRLACCSLFFNPFEVDQVRREVFDESGLRHTAFVHNDATQFAFIFTDIIDLAAHGFAQLFNGFGGETNTHQLGGQCGLRLHIRWRAVAFFVIGFAQFLK